MLHTSAKTQKVIDACVKRVKSVYLTEQARGTHPVLLPEHRVDCLAKLGLAGTCVGYCDCAIVVDDTFYVIAVSYTHLDVYKRQALCWCRRWGDVWPMSAACVR